MQSADPLEHAVNFSTGNIAGGAGGAGGEVGGALAWQHKRAQREQGTKKINKKWIKQNNSLGKSTFLHSMCDEGFTFKIFQVSYQVFCLPPLHLLWSSYPQRSNR